jgi:hypothetical protein
MAVAIFRYRIRNGPVKIVGSLIASSGGADALVIHLIELKSYGIRRVKPYGEIRAAEITAAARVMNKIELSQIVRGGWRVQYNAAARPTAIEIVPPDVEYQVSLNCEIRECLEKPTDTVVVATGRTTKPMQRIVDDAAAIIETILSPVKNFPAFIPPRRRAIRKTRNITIFDRDLPLTDECGRPKDHARLRIAPVAQHAIIDRDATDADKLDGSRQGRRVSVAAIGRDLVRRSGPGITLHREGRARICGWDVGLIEDQTAGEGVAVAEVDYIIRSVGQRISLSNIETWRTGRFAIVSVISKCRKIPILRCHCAISNCRPAGPPWSSNRYIDRA